MNRMYWTHALTQGRGVQAHRNSVRPPERPWHICIVGPWRGGGQGLTDAKKLLYLTAWWVPALASLLLGTLNVSGATDSTLKGCPSKMS